MARARLLRALWDRGIRPLIRSMVSVLRVILEGERTRRGNAIAWTALAAFALSVAWGVSGSIHELSIPTSMMQDIPLALMLSFLRLLAAYILALVWTLPLAMWIGRNDRIARRVLPIVEVIASIPATAFFP